MIDGPGERFLRLTQRRFQAGLGNDLAESYTPRKNHTRVLHKDARGKQKQGEKKRDNAILDCGERWRTYISDVKVEY